MQLATPTRNEPFNAGIARRMVVQGVRPGAAMADSALLRERAAGWSEGISVTREQATEALARQQAQVSQVISQLFPNDPAMALVARETQTKADAGLAHVAAQRERSVEVDADEDSPDADLPVPRG